MSNHETEKSLESAYEAGYEAAAKELNSSLQELLFTVRELRQLQEEAVNSLRRIVEDLNRRP